MERSRMLTCVLAVLILPFYLNDIANMYVKSWQWWLFIDYAGVKLFPLLIIIWMVYSNRLSAEAFGITPQPPLNFIVTCLVVALVGTLIDQNAYGLIERFPGYTSMGGMPKIDSSFWDWVDLTFGLLMVGICEEVVFRGYMHTFISQYTQKAIVIVLISAIAFGLIHWSLGLHAVLITSIIGAVFMVAYLFTKSLPAIMLAHFLINFIDFAGIIPKSIFKFF